MLVTGAGSGLGGAVAECLARSGDRVFGTVRRADRARALTEEAAAKSISRLEFLPLDLLRSPQTDALVDRLIAEGGVDIVVHNAGFGVFGPVEEVGEEMVHSQLSVSLLGPLRLTQRLLPTLRERRGRVLWIGSLAGRIALPFQAHYSASKAAVAALSDAMRLELAPHGVQVCCIEPGDFATGFPDARVCSPLDASCYSEAARRCLAAVERSERDGASPESMARAVERLTRRRRMPARMPVGRWARTIAFLRGVLPSGVVERLVGRIYDL